MTRRFPRRFNVLTKPSRAKYLMGSDKIPKYVGFRANPAVEVPTPKMDDAQDLKLDVRCTAPSTQDSSGKKTVVCCYPTVPPRPAIRLPSRMVRLINAAADHGQEVTPAMIRGDNSDNKNEDGHCLSNGNITY